MTWLSRYLTSTHRENAKRDQAELALIKQAKDIAALDTKAHFTNFASSIDGIATFALSGAAYKLITKQSKHSTSSNSSSSSSSSSSFSLTSMLLLVNQVNTFLSGHHDSGNHSD